MGASWDEVEKHAREVFDAACANAGSIRIAKALLQESAVVTVPPFQEKLLGIGDFEQITCAALFIDMRRSTDEMNRHGPRFAYVWAQTFHATMAFIVAQSRTGYVIDYVGDGVYVLFISKTEEDEPGVILEDAGGTSCRMMQAATGILNDLMQECRDLSDYGIVNKFSYGIGIDYGPAVVTKIGTEAYKAIIAIGGCINTASKTANGPNRVIVSPGVRTAYPKGEGGKIAFGVGKDGQHSLLWDKYPWTK